MPKDSEQKSDTVKSDPVRTNSAIVTQKSIEDGSYFSDALDWYIFRYVNPVCERTMLFFVGLISIFITYNLYFIIEDVLPIVEEKPIIIKAGDTSRYFPVIKKLRDSTIEGSTDTRTVDEVVVKYLLINYLKEREEYDFRKSDIEDVNRKFRVIKNNSSLKEYRNFQAFMNENNPASSINNFGKNVTRYIKIESFNFKRIKINNIIDKARDFISIDIPTEAEVRYTAITTKNGKATSEKYLNKIFFKFSGISSEDKKKDKKKLEFLVIDYKIYRIK